MLKGIVVAKEVGISIPGRFTASGAASVGSPFPMWQE